MSLGDRSRVLLKRWTPHRRTDTDRVPETAAGRPKHPSSYVRYDRGNTALRCSERL
ncbi:Hypothetical protein MexAM1_META1p4845 [Methylorubrum extorquens AM1]|uniref:Uncharacterized protein n=1 Tax=Methylorubrum extorquens (strain ATCC 14718 / DSM 1338 / JCM 2805 / NCIMB 9133 / AM1) TaxID=272630 RepID=C5ARW6_METEA|nr:Hypothetical protein MexAM1_META1p4845 [Methylorubrum extorquens AM1]